LPTPFTLVATQNPIEAQGVFDLPEAQRDRFQLKLTVDVLAPGDERELLDRFDDHPDLHPEQVDQVVDVEALLQSRERVHAVHVDDKIKQYILAIVAATREHDEIVYGASPRAAIAYMNACKARAAIEGREYVIPDDVAEMGGSVLAHRLVLSTDADLRDRTPEAVVEAVLAGVDVPRDEVGEAADGE
jgi:MoxR-like ATPase